jgi:flagellar basal-body rod protein FlgC
MFDSLDVGASGLQAQQTRINVIAANVANASTTHDASGKPIPWRRHFAVLATGAPDDPSKPGVHVESVKQDMAPFNEKYEPGNKDADANGYVKYPNFDPVIEMTNAIEASRAYEANATMMEVTKSMINSSLRLLG